MTLRILIVDDEEIIIRSCSRIIGDSNYKVDTMMDSENVMRQMEVVHYDIAILDIMMPNMSGLELLPQIRDRHPGTEVIMMTGLAQVQTAELALRQGAFDYIPKPFDPETLMDAIERAAKKINPS